MKRLALAFVMLMLACVFNALCGCAMVVPDYNDHKFVRSDVTPMVNVKIYPGRNVCTNEKDSNGKDFVRLTVIVTLMGLELMPVRIDINRAQHVDFPADTGFTLDYRAGVGYHYIEVYAGDRNPVLRKVNVSNCPTRPWTPRDPH